MKVSIIATFQGRNCIKIDGDRSSILQLTVDASQVRDVKELVDCLEKPLKVTIECEEGGDANA